LILTENQLDEWVLGNVEDAQGLIVETVSRLVAASVGNPRARRFPLGDSIGQHGPDGFLDTESGYAPFVPNGQSMWEIGVGVAVRDKATRDYRELTKATPEGPRVDTTFVFVTPHSGRRNWQFTWKSDAQQVWLRKRRAQGRWKDVLVIDGTGMIDWLRRFPGVEMWLVGRMFGVSEADIEPAAVRWALLKGIGGPPPLTPEVFLGNREIARQSLDQLFEGNLLQLTLKTRFPDQIGDFVAAHIQLMEPDRRIEAEGRCLLVSSTNGWNISAALQDRHILVAEATLDLTGSVGTRLLQRARQAGHAVILGGPPGGTQNATTTILASPQAHQLADALRHAGYPDERARLISTKSSGNLGSALRLLQELSVHPEWAQGTEAAELAIAALIGGWTEQAADVGVVEGIAGNAYGAWIATMRRVAHRRNTPLILNDGTWKFVLRYEGWYALGPHIYSEHLDRLRQALLTVLSEIDPALSLPPEDRFMAPVRGLELHHSADLRTGLAEALALLGSHPRALVSVANGMPERLASSVVGELLDGADWTRWATLNSVLPELAEASPEAFLTAVEEATETTDGPMDVLRGQERGGVTGRTYLSGLMWALETLAWNPDYLSRVATALATIAERDPGGPWGNRPSNVLTTIFLPWFPQTAASLAARQKALETLAGTRPAAAWELLLSLLPGASTVSASTRRPAFRDWIPAEWSQETSLQQYWDDVIGYFDLAIRVAKEDGAKLAQLLEHADELPPNAFLQLLSTLQSPNTLALDESARSLVWSALVELIVRHRRHREATWAMPPDRIAQLEIAAATLEPADPGLRYGRLFTDQDFDLYEEAGSFESQREQLATRRRDAVEEVATEGGLNRILWLAERVDSPWTLGFAFGSTAQDEHDAALLPALLIGRDQRWAQFVAAYVRGKHATHGWDWVDALPITEWSREQIGRFLSYLPFDVPTWRRASTWLGIDESPYWTATTANPFEASGDLTHAIDQLIANKRPLAAIRCLYKRLHSEGSIDVERGLTALSSVATSIESAGSVNQHELVDVISALQSADTVDEARMASIEWAFLPILDRISGAAPRVLERSLATNPEFFCEVIAAVFQPAGKGPSGEPPERNVALGRSGYKLLSGWATPPGSVNGVDYDGKALERWLSEVRRLCGAADRLDVALVMVGHVLAHAPADADGLWIARDAANVLNGADAKKLREGFATEVLNQRGAHFVDPTAKPELELAASYRAKADSLESEGFIRLAATVRDIASFYEAEAGRIVSRATNAALAGKPF
jgi:hypothetical protein